ncbi:MAG: caspase family protein [Bacteroidota bacterium]
MDHQSAKTPPKRSIHVLSIGINRYKDPEISPLRGCLKDVQKLKAFLQKTFDIEEHRYSVLTNERATRQRIVDTFREHFLAMKAGDTLLFHFSGHGSWEKMSPEFASIGLQPKGSRNELLVCYDSGDPGVYNLADKELRLLLAEVQQAVANVHAIFIFDCCHSGSMLRTEGSDLRVRMTPRRKGPRPIKAYLEGQYAQQDILQLPSVSYISMAACKPRQSAVETSNGGIFLDSLLKVLGQAIQQAWLPTYATLFPLVQQQTKHNAQNLQHPQFDYHGNVNPYDAFLKKGTSATDRMPQLLQKDGRWQVAMGALHGLEKEELQAFKIPIFDSTNTSTPIGHAELDRIELEYTVLKNLSFVESMANQPAAISYLAGLSGHRLLLNLPPSNDSASNLARKMLQEEKYKHRFQLAQQADYQLQVTVDQLSIQKIQADQLSLIYGIRQTDPIAHQHILSLLSKIARWERVSSLAAPKNSSIDESHIHWQLQYTDYDGQAQSFSPQSSGTYRLNLNYDPKKGGIPYGIQVTNHTKYPLYFYLVHLNAQYDISQKNEDYAKALYPLESILLYDSIAHNVGLGITQAAANETLDTFLLLASREKLHLPFLFQQRAFGHCFGQVVGSLDEWFARSGIDERGDVPIGGQQMVHWMVLRMEVCLRR